MYRCNLKATDISAVSQPGIPAYLPVDPFGLIRAHLRRHPNRFRDVDEGERSKLLAVTDGDRNYWLLCYR